MKICLLTLYLNHCNESKLIFGRKLGKLSWFFFFCGLVKLICKLRHTFFINLRLRQKLNLWPSALFHKNLRSAAGKLAHSAVCGKAYAPLPLKQLAILKNTSEQLLLTLLLNSKKLLTSCEQLSYYQFNVT